MIEQSIIHVYHDDIEIGYDDDDDDDDNEDGGDSNAMEVENRDSGPHQTSWRITHEEYERIKDKILRRILESESKSIYLFYTLFILYVYAHTFFDWLHHNKISACTEDDLEVLFMEHRENVMENEDDMNTEKKRFKSLLNNLIEVTDHHQFN